MSESENPRPDGSERRRDDRRLTCVVAEVEGKDKSSLALIRNVSRSGALLFAARNLDVGSDVELLIHTSADPDAKKIETSAKIVRREGLDPERTDLWRWELGVEFTEPLDGADEELAALAAAIERKQKRGD